LTAFKKRNAAEMIGDTSAWEEGGFDYLVVMADVALSCVRSLCHIRDACLISVDDGSMAAVLSILITGAVAWILLL
jgi:hypothetical protein